MLASFLSGIPQIFNGSMDLFDVRFFQFVSIFLVCYFEQEGYEK